MALLPGLRRLSYFFLNLFIYFELCWVFTAACRSSLVLVSRGYFFVMCFSLQWSLLLQSTGSRARRLQELQHAGSVVVAIS